MRKIYKKKNLNKISNKKHVKLSLKFANYVYMFITFLIVIFFVFFMIHHHKSKTKSRSSSSIYSPPIKEGESDGEDTSQGETNLEENTIQEEPNLEENTIQEESDGEETPFILATSSRKDHTLKSFLTYGILSWSVGIILHILYNKGLIIPESNFCLTIIITCYFTSLTLFSRIVPISKWLSIGMFASIIPLFIIIYDITPIKKIYKSVGKTYSKIVNFGWFNYLCFFLTFIAIVIPIFLIIFLDIPEFEDDDEDDDDERKGPLFSERKMAMIFGGISKFFLICGLISIYFSILPTDNDYIEMLNIFSKIINKHVDDLSYKQKLFTIGILCLLISCSLSCINLAYYKGIWWTVSMIIINFLIFQIAVMIYRVYDYFKNDFWKTGFGETLLLFRVPFKIIWTLIKVILLILKYILWGIFSSTEQRKKNPIYLKECIKPLKDLLWGSIWGGGTEKQNQPKCVLKPTRKIESERRNSSRSSLNESLQFDPTQNTTYLHNNDQYKISSQTPSSILNKGYKTIINNRYRKKSINSRNNSNKDFQPGINFSYPGDKSSILQSVYQPGFNFSYPGGKSSILKPVYQPFINKISNNSKGNSSRNSSNNQENSKRSSSSSKNKENSKRNSSRNSSNNQENSKRSSIHSISNSPNYAPFQ